MGVGGMRGTCGCDSAPRRRRVVLAAIAATIVVMLTLAGCGGSGVTANAPTSSGLYGSLPRDGTPIHGGTITFAQLAGDTPTYILPVVPASQATTTNLYQFINNMFLPLYAAPVGARPEVNQQLSVGKPPVYSNHDRTVTVQLKRGFKWADGAPVDADDVVFDIDLTKAAVKESPANLRRYTPGLYPDNVKRATAVGRYTVVLQLTRSFNPAFFTNDELGIGDVAPLPSTAWNIASAGGPHLDYANPANAKRIYDYLSAQGAKVSTFSSNPLWKDVDGPFKLTSFTPVTGSYTMAPNPSYGGSPKPRFDRLQVDTYTAVTPIANALKTGTLDIGPIDMTQLGMIPGLKQQGYRVFGLPAFGFTDGVLNFKDKTNDFDRVIAQRYVRQALASLIDQPAMIKGILKSAGAPGYGPIPPVPSSVYTNADVANPAYPYDPATARKLLSSHGWKVVSNGTTTCVKPGTGSGECGAGIPAGTPISFTWVWANLSPTVGLEAEAFAAAAAKVGIKVAVVEKSFNYVISNYDDASPAAAGNADRWGVIDFTGLTDPAYPTTNSVFNRGGSFNFGAYHSAKADRLIDASIHGNGVADVQREAAFLAKDVPALFLPNADNLYAVKGDIGGPPDSFASITQYFVWPQYWYRTKKP